MTCAVHTAFSVRHVLDNVDGILNVSFQVTLITIQASISAMMFAVYSDDDDDCI